MGSYGELLQILQQLTTAPNIFLTTLGEKKETLTKNKERKIKRIQELKRLNNKITHFNKKNMRDLNIGKEDLKLALMDMIMGEKGAAFKELMANFFADVIKVGVKEKSDLEGTERSIYFVLESKEAKTEIRSIDYYKKNYAIKKEDLEGLRDLWEDDISAEEFLKARKK